MLYIAVQCPHCHSEQIVKRGKTRCGTQLHIARAGEAEMDAMWSFVGKKQRSALAVACH